jgi:hypothetical protein
LVKSSRRDVNAGSLLRRPDKTLRVFIREGKIDPLEQVDLL